MRRSRTTPSSPSRQASATAQQRREELRRILSRGPEQPRKTWRQHLRPGLIAIAVLVLGLITGGWWLADKPWLPASWRWLQPRLEQIEPAPLKAALDRSAFARAEQADTETAYQAYLDRCTRHDCAYRTQAKARIKALRLSAEHIERRAQLQHKAADLDAYSEALQVETQSAYKAYLDRCAEHGCSYREQAQQRLIALRAETHDLERQSALERELVEQAARATELEQQIEQLMVKLDRVAFDRAEQADTDVAYRAYLSDCADTGCWHRPQAEERLAQLTERSRRFADKPEMATLNAGCFQMRSPSAGDGVRANQSQQVCVDALKVAKHEVTFSQYDRFAQATGRAPPDDEGWGRDNRPVINVSLEHAMAYAAWLSEQTGRQYRLPTEAEWEFAARAGTQTTRYWGEASEAACAYANVHDQISMRENPLSTPPHACNDGYAKTAPVGQFQPNAWGLYDMLGNVWEWTCSAYSGDYDGTEQRCAKASNAGFRSIRGGAWHSGPQFVHAAARSGVLPNNQYGGLGFRLVMD